MRTDFTAMILQRLPMASMAVLLLFGPLAGSSKAMMFSVVHHSKEPTRSPGDFQGVWPVHYSDLNYIGTLEAWHRPPSQGGSANFILEIFNRSQKQLCSIEGGCLVTPWDDGHGRYRFMLEKLPLYYKNEIYYGGYLSLPWEIARKYVWDKKEERSLAGQPWTSIDPDSKMVEACYYKCDVDACLQYLVHGDPNDPYWRSELEYLCDCVWTEPGGTYCKPKFLNTLSLPLGVKR